MPDIAQGVIDAILSPVVTQLKLGAVTVIGPGPVDGALAVPTPLPTTAYGVKVDFITVPASWGRKLGNPNSFEPALLQLALEIFMQDGNSVANQIEWIGYDGQLKLWAGGLPTNLLYHVEPGVTLSLTWLVVF